jgi:hypothetical protein
MPLILLGISFVDFIACEICSNLVDSMIGCKTCHLKVAQVEGFICKMWINFALDIAPLLHSPLIPTFVRDLPAKATLIIIQYLNVEERDWKELASEIWPEMSLSKLKAKLRGDKIEAVLTKWGQEDGKTEELLKILQKMKRYNVLEQLQSIFSSIKYK